MIQWDTNSPRPKVGGYLYLHKNLFLFNLLFTIFLYLFGYSTDMIYKNNSNIQPTYKKHRAFVFVFLGIVLFFGFCFALFRSPSCAKEGYTIALVNGINTTETDAQSNLGALQEVVGHSFNGEPIDYEYLYNPTHMAALSDISDTVTESLFNQTNKYDIENILIQASKKIKTQKLLLVGYSEGNFYVNDVYDTLANTRGNPPSSVRVFAIATPADHIASVASGAENKTNYIISDTDVVINKIANTFSDVLHPNVHIQLQSGDDAFGHSFKDVYLKYQSASIVSGVQSQLAQLRTTPDRNVHTQCITNPDVTFLDTVQGDVYAVVDPLFTTVKNFIAGIPESFALTYTTDKNIVSNVTHSLLGNTTNLASGSTTATALLADTQAIPNKKIEAQKPSVLSSGVPQKPIHEIVSSVPVVSTQAPTRVDTPQLQTSISPVRISNSNSTIPVVSQPVLPKVGGEGSSVPIVTAATPTLTQPSSTSANTNQTPSLVANNTTTTVASTNDGISPVITLNGSNKITISKDSIYTDQGATAHDARDGVIPVIDTGTVDTTVLGAYILTYTATDTQGNTTTASRTVTVVAKKAPPVVTIKGASSVTTSKGSSYTEEGATAVDADGLPISVIITGTVNTAVPDTYTVTYKATDIQGNTTIINRTVVVTNIINTVAAQKKYFDAENKLYYQGKFIICNMDTAQMFENGDNTPLAPYLSGTNWQTQYQLKANENMPVNTNLRFIFESDEEALSDCTNNTYNVGYSDTFHYTTSSGASFVADNDKIINSFSITSDTTVVTGTITDSTHTITLAVPAHTDITHVVPTLTFSAKATIVPVPNTPQDFTRPVIYTLTAADGSVVQYSVAVVVSGKKLSFDPVTNQIPYSGEFVLCDMDHKTIVANGSTLSSSSSTPFVSSTNWQTRYQATANENMLIATNLRFIFGDNTQAIADCAHDTYINDYSNAFYYTTASGSSVVYGQYQAQQSTPVEQPSGDNNTPSIVNYTLNGNPSSLTVNPLATSVTLDLTASVAVNWMSIKIENQADPNIYKVFQSGVGCVDGTTTCTKIWNGSLSSGDTLTDGVYRIKVHMKDANNAEFDEYLSPYTIMIDTTK